MSLSSWSDMLFTGRGVFAITDISHGQFIVQYDGQLVSEEEGRKREAEEPSVFRYFFKWKNKKYW